MSEEISARTALVLYGSETGNAQDLAEELGRTSQKLHFATEVISLDSIEPIVLNSYSIVLISISTTGQGQLPASSRIFWKKLLQKRLPRDHLGNAQIAVFGLGDTSYPQYNWAALKLHKRLRQVGAVDLVPRGEGDEQHPEGYDSAFVPWVQGLKARLLEAFPLPNGYEPIPDDVLLQPPWLLGLSVESDTGSVNGISEAPKNGVVSNGDNPNEARPFEVELIRNQRVTAHDHFQDVRHFAFVTPERHEYSPGDILTIHPENMQEDVDRLLSVTRWGKAADYPVHFVLNPDYVNATRPRYPDTVNDEKLAQSSMTLRNLLTSHLDFSAIPRRSFFALIAHFTNDEFQKERLLEFANPELIDELFDYTTRPRRSILEVLQEFDTLSIPWQWAATILPQLRGRQFSIASGGILKDPSVNKHDDIAVEGKGTKFELLIAIVKYRTVIKKIRRGVCTRYLEDLQPGARLSVTLQRGALGITPLELAKPVVMVGPGTGLAPIRALIWQRWLWAQTSPPNAREPGRMVMFFGCRNEQSDYFFRDEWRQLQDQGVPLTVFAAFSRDQAAKMYVQDRIREQHELLFELLQEQQGIVFVCGSSGKMPQAVRSALLDVLQKGAGVDPAEAEQRLKVMEKEGRYKQETW